ncbi:MAG: beta-ketoacyl-[acyl-carrier-protein] synthase family protein [Planctomycetes bacterium]|nr:beta-ketoacyl-[acyl-carrier-protein] synthase family protein [Planctomycetota bacterium]
MNPDFTNPPRRVVITGMGLVCPLGSTPATFWSAMMAGQSGVAPTSFLPPDRQPLKFAGEARQFTGEVEDFGPVDKERKKAIKKGLKVMCRETRMAVAAAQLAIADAGFAETPMDPDASGVVLGSDYMLTMPEDYEAGVKSCAPAGEFQFPRWGREGLGEMAPLWMLKYLPNMPASHIAIYNDLRGPNNALTMREAAGNLAIGEAFRTIQRGHANRMVAGATGTRILPMQAIHALQTEQMAAEDCDPAKASRPFDKNRTGMVAGEGAGMVVLEELSSAKSRGATIYAEVVGLGSASVARGAADLRGKCDVAIASAMRAALRDAGRSPADVGHINAHGLSTTDRDAEEARAIREVFGPRTDTLPVTAPKSYFGNLGAGSAVVELIASVLALREGHLPGVLNYETPDPACPLAVVTDDQTPPGRSFLNLSVTPQGQAAVLFVAACE